jgi:hypothetical protein
VRNENHSNISDEKEANFIRILQKGCQKYKGKLPFKCFNCGKVGHFSSKCPYPKQVDSDDENTYNHKELKKRKMELRRNSTRKRKTYSPKKTIVHLT